MTISPLRDAGVSPVRSVVRELDWIEETLGRRQKIVSSWTADTAVGSYWIERKKKFWLNRPAPHGKGKAYFDTLEEAKAAGQEDFVLRISACLVDEPKSDDDVVHDWAEDRPASTEPLDSGFPSTLPPLKGNSR